MDVRSSARFCRIAQTILVLWLALATLLAQSSGAPQKIVVRAGKMFDPVAGRMIDNPVVVISGNKIESISNGNSGPIQGAIAIDLGDATLLPGFIHVDTHLT